MNCASATPRDRRNPVTPLFQLYLAATEAGIARNALHDATRFAREGPPHQAQLGAAFGGRPLCAGDHRADRRPSSSPPRPTPCARAEAIDAAWADRLSNASLTEASIAVAQAQYFASMPR